MRFQHPEYFIGLLLIPLLVFLYYRLTDWKKRLGARIGDPALVALLVKSFSARNFLLKFMVICLAVFLLIAGLANLRAKGKAENISRQGVDVMIVLDVRKRRLKVRFVMIIDQRDGARDVFVAGFLPVFDELIADHVGNGQRPVVVALLA